MALWAGCAVAFDCIRLTKSYTQSIVMLPETIETYHIHCGDLETRETCRNELADLLCGRFKLQASLAVGLSCSDVVQLSHVLFYQMGQDIMMLFLWVR